MSSHKCAGAEPTESTWDSEGAVLCKNNGISHLRHSPLGPPACQDMAFWQGATRVGEGCLGSAHQHSQEAVCQHKNKTRQVENQREPHHDEMVSAQTRGILQAQGA